MADFKVAYNAGFDLLGDFTGYRRAVIVDSIISGLDKPGTVKTFDISRVEASFGGNLSSLHALGFQSIVEIGIKCGYSMPDEIKIISIEAADVTTFSETPTPVVEAATAEVVKKIGVYLDDLITARNRARVL